MQHRFLSMVMVLVLAAFAVAPAMAQGGYCTIKGSFKGQDGKPMADVQVDLSNTSTGTKYHVKTDKRGEFSSLGIAPGQYNLSFNKDGKEIWTISNYTMSLQKENGLNIIDVDLQKEAKAAPQMSEEQKKEMERVTKENTSIKALNAMLQEAQADETAGNFDGAIAVMDKATQADPTRPMLWAQLGIANTMGGKKETDPAARTKKFSDAVDAYKKAIDLATASTDVKVKASLGGYYNNYGEALGRSGKTADAVAAYGDAAKADPTSAAMYYRNEGITMENAGKVDDAVAAYDKSIAADPASPDSYFRKGITLLSKAVTKGDKMVPAPGTAEAFNKYLELAPDGPNAQTAKDMLTTIGATVQTSYGTKSSGKKK